MGIGASTAGLIAAGVGAAGSIGSSLIGGGKSSGGSTSSTSSNVPWAPQQGYLTQGYQNAQDIYNTRTAAGPYTGEFTAGPNGIQGNAANIANFYAQNEGSNLTGQISGTASGLLNSAPAYQANAGNIAANGIAGPNAGLSGTLQGFGTGANTTQGPNPGLSTALNQSAISGANAMGTFQNGLNNAAGTAASDPTSRITADASQYANNPGVQAAIKSTNAGIDQTLNEQTVPGLNREAAMGGALNSSRAGMAEGMANEGAGIAKGNADASILNNAYNTGTATAGNMYATGLNSSINANLGGYNASAAAAEGVGNQQQGLSEFNTNTQLGAANSGLSQNLAYGQADANARLAGNAQLGNAVSLGENGVASANNSATSNFGLQSSAGNLQQTGQQALDTNALNQWQMGDQYQQGVLHDYMGVVGNIAGNNQTETKSAQLPLNLPGSALGGALAGSGLYQNLFPTSDQNSYGTTNATDPYGPNGVSQATQNTIASNAAPFASYQPDPYGGLY